jgi:hypothetical protein
MQIPSLLFQATLLFFINVGGNIIMVDDVTTSSNPSSVPIQDDFFLKTPFNMNVFQQPCEEELIRSVMHTRMAKFVWNYQVSSKLCALAIYLELVPPFENWLERFYECQCKDDDVGLFSQTWVFHNRHYYWLKRLINLLPMEHKHYKKSRLFKRSI